VKLVRVTVSWRLMMSEKDMDKMLDEVFRKVFGERW
jgi:Mrp family chromosome partitioning ATPase